MALPSLGVFLFVPLSSPGVTCRVLKRSPVTFKAGTDTYPTDRKSTTDRKEMASHSHVLAPLQIATFWKWPSPSTFTTVYIDLLSFTALKNSPKKRGRPPPATWASHDDWMPWTFPVLDVRRSSHQQLRPGPCDSFQVMAVGIHGSGSQRCLDYTSVTHLDHLGGCREITPTALTLCQIFHAPFTLRLHGAVSKICLRIYPHGHQIITKSSTFSGEPHDGSIDWTHQWRQQGPYHQSLREPISFAAWHQNPG